MRQSDQLPYPHGFEELEVFLMPTKIYYHTFKSSKTVEKPPINNLTGFGHNRDYFGVRIHAESFIPPPFSDRRMATQTTH